MSSSSDRVIKLIVRKIIPASREEVFSAWTDPESIRHWMCPGEIIEAEAQLEVRVGRAFQPAPRKAGADPTDDTCKVTHAALASAVSEALTMLQGLPAWWTTDCDVTIEVGGIRRFVSVARLTS